MMDDKAFLLFALLNEDIDNEQEEEAEDCSLEEFEKLIQNNPSNARHQDIPYLKAKSDINEESGKTNPCNDNIDSCETIDNDERLSEESICKDEFNDLDESDIIEEDSFDYDYYDDGGSPDYGYRDDLDYDE